MELGVPHATCGVMGDVSVNADSLTGNVHLAVLDIGETPAASFAMRVV